MEIITLFRGDDVEQLIFTKDCTREINFAKRKQTISHRARSARTFHSTNSLEEEVYVDEGHD